MNAPHAGSAVRGPVPTNVLDVERLSVAYGKVLAVRDVSLHVAPGTIVTVIGPNGAGKTTLLAAIAGLLPAHGVVRCFGDAATSLSVEQRVGRGLVLVPEKRELFASMSVADNLRLGAFTRRRDRTASALADVYGRFPRLAERRDQLAGTLSGGERQMLALGRALMAAPRLLLLDEPSLGLAPLVVRDIFAIIATLRATGVAVLLVEQNARAALQ
ncbi:MAG TPA: ABC transporter ATP-binding protein, partial [Casimicrobiaceae bacterium]